MGKNQKRPYCTVLISREGKASACEQGRERPLQSPKVTGLRGRNPFLADSKKGGAKSLSGRPLRLG